jgi:hypothetical protein
MFILKRMEIKIEGILSSGKQTKGKKRLQDVQDPFKSHRAQSSACTGEIAVRELIICSSFVQVGILNPWTETGAALFLVSRM